MSIVLLVGILQVPDSLVIVINNKPIAARKEKAYIIAEEYRYYRTTYGNTLYQKNAPNIKQENEQDIGHICRDITFYVI
ncbi:MAG: hypothetical protein ACOYIB_06850 [Desulfosporosinus sp.]